ncbi:hypothetical protein [Bacilliculturomica massiliensis]|uniref:hypothetical protein n=1 Tax=Bacilliculturomica massiliensis TaxID=1917867 RepID=UPI0012B93680|nr:hypothetical protein [Bacilliculturomica massiliensis]
MLHQLKNKKHLWSFFLLIIGIICVLAIYVIQENRELKEYEECCKYQAAFYSKYMEITEFVEGQLINGVRPYIKPDINDNIKDIVTLTNHITDETYMRGIMELYKIVDNEMQSSLFADEEEILSALTIHKNEIGRLIELRLIADRYMGKDISGFNQISIDGNVLKFKDVNLNEDQINKIMNVSEDRLEFDFVRICRDLLFDRITTSGDLEKYEEIKGDKKLLKEYMPFTGR